MALRHMLSRARTSSTLAPSSSSRVAGLADAAAAGPASGVTTTSGRPYGSTPSDPSDPNPPADREAESQRLQEDVQYCHGLVRRYAYPSYLCLAPLSHSSRHPLAILRALALEARHAAGGGEVGEGGGGGWGGGFGGAELKRGLAAARLAWWRDGARAAARADGRGRVPDAPALRALQQLSLRAPVSPYRLGRLFAAVAEEAGLSLDNEGSSGDEAEDDAEAEAAVDAPDPCGPPSFPPSPPGAGDPRRAQPADLAALEARCEGSETQVLLAAASCLGLADPVLDHALSHLGRGAGMAMALAGSLRGLERGLVVGLPERVGGAGGGGRGGGVSATSTAADASSILRAADVVAGTAPLDAIQDRCWEVAVAARNHLRTAERLGADVESARGRALLLGGVHPTMVLEARERWLPPPLLVCPPVSLSLSPILRHHTPLPFLIPFSLQRLEKLDFNPLDPGLLRGLSGVNPLACQVRLLWRGFRLR